MSRARTGPEYLGEKVFKMNLDDVDPHAIVGGVAAFFLP